MKDIEEEYDHFYHSRFFLLSFLVLLHAHLWEVSRTEWKCLMIGARVMCVCLCFFLRRFFSSLLSRFSPLTSHCNVPPLRSTRFISVASSPEQGNIHTYIHISSSSCVCVPKVEYHPPAIHLQRGISIIIIVEEEEEEER